MVFPYRNSLLPWSVNIRDGTHFKFAPHQLPQSVWESIAWTHLRAAKMHSQPDQNTKWPCVRRFAVPVLNFCSTSLYFCQVHPYQMRWVKTILPSSDCARQWCTSVILCGTSTVPF